MSTINADGTNGTNALAGSQRDGGAAGGADAIADAATDASNIAYANNDNGGSGITGGTGGSGAGLGSGGAGGEAVASATTVLDNPAGTNTAAVIADGGTGGASQGGPAGAGGNVTSAVASVSGGLNGVATVLAAGGQGGLGGSYTTKFGNVVYGADGAAGTVSGASAYAEGLQSATASVTQTGDSISGGSAYAQAQQSATASLTQTGDSISGGSAYAQAQQSATASVTQVGGGSLVNAVSGETDGGMLTLSQTEYADAGYDGTATSSLDFDDLLNATQSQAITTTATVQGLNAFASNTTYGAGAVDAIADATGGVPSEAQSSVAQAHAIGDDATADATAAGGAESIAIATATGATADANAISEGGYTIEVQATATGNNVTASATVSGSSSVTDSFANAVGVESAQASFVTYVRIGKNAATNQVEGSTRDGTLTLSQSVFGSLVGSSILIFNDFVANTIPDRSASLTGSVSAQADVATAIANIKGKGDVAANATATDSGAKNSATASATAISTTGAAVASATAIGGRGAGQATIRAVVADGVTSATATATEVGGEDGGKVSAIGELTGQTNGGDLTLNLNIFAGGALAQRENAHLDFDDYLNETLSKSVTANLVIVAGSGDPDKASKRHGGLAQGSADVIGAGTAAANVTVTGGAGAAVGINAGGEGGRVGPGVDGDPNTGSEAVAVGASATASVVATGGAGGSADGFTRKDQSGVGGAGGTVAGARALATGVHFASASVTQIGGAAGIGLEGSSGGAGAGSAIHNGVFATIDGGEMMLSQTAVGGAGGLGGAGGAGGNALSFLAFDDLTENATHADDLFVTNNAYGGAGGYGAGLGGQANARADIVGAQNVALAIHVAAGAGGSADLEYQGDDLVNRYGFSGGGGGTATLAYGKVTGEAASVSVNEQGGDGGVGTNAGAYGGAGGAAFRGSAIADGVTLAIATLTEIGGAGGAGVNKANGGVGATSNLFGGAAGSTQDGALTLWEEADGGAGGASDGGIAGAGGGAHAATPLTDEASASDNVTAIARGGDGGNGTGGSASAAGGYALATVDARSAGALTASSLARGGDGGTGTPHGAGGLASATTDATGASVAAASRAIGGVGADAAAYAHATTDWSGASGSYLAQATSSPAGLNLVTALTASASGLVDGAGSAQASAGIAIATPANDDSLQAVATAIGLPQSADVSPVVAANSSFGPAFGAAPTFLAQGELGGQHQSGAASETVDDQVDLTLHAPALASADDLWLGLYDGSSLGAGVSGMTFDVKANGDDVVNQTFASGAAAAAFFNNDALNLGAWSTLGASKTIALQITLTETTTGAGNGLYGDYLLGASHI